MSRFKYVVSKLVSFAPLKLFHLGIDLGSFKTRVMIDRKLVFDEPTCIAVHQSTRQVVAIGDKAFSLLGRTASTIQVVFPLERDSIQNAEILQLFLSKMIEQATHSASPRFAAKVAIPLALSQSHQEVLTEILNDLGSDTSVLIHRGKAVFNSLINQHKISSTGCFLIMGNGSTDIMMLAQGDELAQTSIPIGGIDYSDAIMKTIRQKYHVEIGLQRAYAIRDEIGGISNRGLKKHTTVVRGKELISCLPVTITVTAVDFEDEFQKLTQEIAKQITYLFSTLSSELINEVIETGIILTGGSSQILGLESFLEEALHCQVKKMPQSEYDVVRGLTYDDT